MDELTNYTPNIIILNDISICDIQDYDIFDEKDCRKFINDVKKRIRNSLEYRQLVQYLRNFMGMNECSFFENVNNMDTSKIRIELHHSPYTLEDIVTTVLNKRIFYGEEIDVEDVAKEVMYIHYFLMVGLIPLSETVHELVHNQFLFVPTNKVVGNYKEFEEVYGNWISDEVKDKIKMYENRTLTYNVEIDKALLQQKQLPVEINDEYISLPTMETLESLMNNKLEEIRMQNAYSLTDNSTYDNNIIEEKVIRGVTYDNIAPELIPGVSYVV